MSSTQLISKSCLNSTSTIIVHGSGRAKGNTYQFAAAIAPKLHAEIVNLNDFTIAPFDYEYKNSNDDFFTLMRHVLTFDRIIFASPIYWYSPSAQMKCFMDRLSDLLDIEKDLGRQLRGKSAAVIATGVTPTATQCFQDVFRLTIEYLGMTYQGCAYACCDDEISLLDHQAAIEEFVAPMRALST